MDAVSGRSRAASSYHTVAILSSQVAPTSWSTRLTYELPLAVFEHHPGSHVGGIHDAYDQPPRNVTVFVVDRDHPRCHEPHVFLGSHEPGAPKHGSPWDEVRDNR